MERIEREPCPHRIIDDAGGAFVFGLIGGSIWHTVGGFRNAPKGQGMTQAMSRVAARVPVLGGSFAVWGTLFSVCDCSFTYIRKKEDPWNAIISGAATGGILAARAGMKAAGKSAMVGGVILAAIEGLNVLLMRVMMPMFEKDAKIEAGQVTVDRLLPPVDPSRSRHSFSRSNGGQSQSIFQAAPDAATLYGGNDLQFDSRTPNWETQGFGTSTEIKSTETTDEQQQPKSKGWLW